ncbi:carboxypeptidase-like regulatory domain-containing protein [Winogradskyella flava]|uniref:Carboxypeptidase-like regulatory domain-containing protein n=1 Tax=Winogradskyella flava TaxID=1884876 RepID=A0A842ITZ9_9FLAO|nr:carboxypeptidase-like regulatory domain-containing protein [Winogradskyella flava]MBC2845629.1 carboxypeptidase-like regulatory domain-containing protein [Winogradskyella flava]
MRFVLLTLFFSFFSISFASAQGNAHFVFKVFDAETKQAIPYATIRFEGRNTGLIANIDGDFKIPISYVENKDVILVSCIGYSTKRVALESLKRKGLNIIYLSPKIEDLGQVVIKGNIKKQRELSAKQIVKKAIKAIEINYPVDPFSYVAYYRDYQMVDQKYTNLNEGIIEVFDQGFQSHKIKDSLNTTALYKYGLNTQFSQDTLLSNSIYNQAKDIRDGTLGSTINNELTILNLHNPIRNYSFGSFSYVYTFKKNFVRNHNFFSEGTLFLDDEEFYKIRFSAKNVLTDYAYSAYGHLYISKEDFSIHNFDYELYSTSFEKSVFTVNVEYKKHENGKMYLNYISFNNNFYVSKKDVLRIESSKYNKNDNTFVVKFNRAIKLKAIEKRSNVKVYYRDRKLAINKIAMTNPKTIIVHLKEKAYDYLIQQRLDEESLFSIEVRNFEDASGSDLIEDVTIDGYQFRELFVQSVFPNKTVDGDLFFVNKVKSLQEATLNNLDVSDYWMNSPLKTTNN